MRRHVTIGAHVPPRRLQLRDVHGVRIGRTRRHAGYLASRAVAAHGHRARGAASGDDGVVGRRGVVIGLIPDHVGTRGREATAAQGDAARHGNPGLVAHDESVGHPQRIAVADDAASGGAAAQRIAVAERAGIAGRHQIGVAHHLGVNAVDGIVVARRARPGAVDGIDRAQRQTFLCRDGIACTQRTGLPAADCRTIADGQRLLCRGAGGAAQRSSVFCVCQRSRADGNRIDVIGDFVRAWRGLACLRAMAHRDAVLRIAFGVRARCNRALARGDGIRAAGRCVCRGRMGIAADSRGIARRRFGVIAVGDAAHIGSQGALADCHTIVGRRLCFSADDDRIVDSLARALGIGLGVGADDDRVLALAARGIADRHAALAVGKRVVAYYRRIGPKSIGVVTQRHCLARLGISLVAHGQRGIAQRAGHGPDSHRIAAGGAGIATVARQGGIHAVVAGRIGVDGLVQLLQVHGLARALGGGHVQRPVGVVLGGFRRQHADAAAGDSAQRVYYGAVLVLHAPRVHQRDFAEGAVGAHRHLAADQVGNLLLCIAQLPHVDGVIRRGPVCHVDDAALAARGRVAHRHHTAARESAAGQVAHAAGVAGQRGGVRAQRHAGAVGKRILAQRDALAARHARLRAQRDGAFTLRPGLVAQGSRVALGIRVRADSRGVVDLAGIAIGLVANGDVQVAVYTGAGL